jgi:hypothetical protein
MKEPPVFIKDIEQVREFVLRCLKENRDKQEYWDGDWDEG